MPDGLTFKTRVVFNHLPKITAGLERKADMVVGKTAMDMEAGMKRRIREQGAVDTGFLVNSVQARKVGSAHWRVTVGADYGLYVDKGTRFMAARPFFDPTIAEVTPAFLEALKRMSRP